MNFRFSPIEARSKRSRAFLLRLSASSILLVVSWLLLTLSPQAVYGQG
ncbi:MAG: hypothetical protein ICV68_04820 [Pyrinomonadaceae bacterium]|nr:hypothetical protein [Pyrinomonadaceae bacterium]